MDVDQASQRAVIDWQRFDIGAQARVDFHQPNASAVALNRVHSDDPSRIYGQLNANGQVFLVNPAGVLFGPGARVNAAGLVASTLDIGDADFMAGQDRFVRGAGGGSVVNQGSIATPDGGRVYLIGDAVRNEGLIHSPGGRIVLAAGQRVELVDGADPLLGVEIGAVDGSAINLGELVAEGGAIHAYAASLGQQGVARVDSMSTDAAGRIVLRASGEAVLGAASVTSANGGQGGFVGVEADTTRVTGAVSAAGSAGRGGEVRLLGEQVAVYGDARVDASGRTGGGAILVGGDYQGANPVVANARATFIGPDARLSADATGHGDGGRIIAWADQVTRAYGWFSARGGAQGGNGGLVETSGGWLDARPAHLDLGAARGAAGTWLLDPNDLVIGTGGNSNISGGPNFTTTGDSAFLDATVLGGQITGGANIVVQTAAAGANSQSGDITVQADVTAAGTGSLTLRAHRDINIAAGVAITAPGGAVDVSLVSDSDGNQQGRISMGAGSSIDSNGGDIAFGGGGADGRAYGYGANFAGIDLSAGATLAAGAGNVTLTGSGSLTGNGGYGVILSNNSVVSGNAVTLDGVDPDTPDGGSPFSGIAVFNSQINATGAVTLNGSNLGDGEGIITSLGQIDGASIAFAGSGANGIGTMLFDTTAQAAAGGTISVNGSTTAGGHAFALQDSTLTAAGGTITLQGNGGTNITGYFVGGLVNAGQITATATGTAATGIQVDSAGVLQGGATGSVSLNGQGSGYGVTIDDGSVVAGQITLTGSSGSVSGIYLRDATLHAMGNLPLTLNGSTVGTGHAIELVARNQLGAVGYTGNIALLTSDGDIKLLGAAGDFANGSSFTSSGSLTFANLTSTAPYSVDIAPNTTLANTLSGITVGSANSGDLTFYSNSAAINTPSLAVPVPIVFRSAGFVSFQNSLTSTGGSVAVQADGDIYLNIGRFISSAGGPLAISFTADRDGNGNGRIHLDSSSSLSSNGGNIQLAGGGAGGLAMGASAGVRIDGSVNAGAGTVTIGGSGLVAGGEGVLITASGTVSGDTVNITGAAPFTCTPPCATYAGVRHAGIVQGRVIQVNGSSGSNFGTYVQGSVIGNGAGSIDLVGSTTTTALLDGLTVQNGGHVTAVGSSPIRLSGSPWVSIYKHSVNASVGDPSYSGDIQLIGATGITFGFSGPVVSGPELQTSGAVSLVSAAPGSNLTVQLRADSQIVAGAGQTVQIGDAQNTGMTVNLLDGGAVVFANPVLFRSAGMVTFTRTPASTATIVGNAASAQAIQVVGSGFHNDIGSNLLSAPSGRWLVWSGDPAADLRNGLAYDFKQYNAGYGATTPAQPTGNGFLYTLAPTLTVGLTGTVSKVYDGNTNATLAAGNYTASGTVDGDTVSLNNPAAGSYDNRNAGSGKTVTVTGITASAGNGAAAVYGYQLASTNASGAVGVITRRPVNVSGVTVNDKVYDGTTNATLTGAGSLTGVLPVDAVTLVTTAANAQFADKHIGVNKTVSISGLSLGGTSAGNYQLSAASTSGQADIHYATLTLQVPDQVRSEGSHGPFHYDLLGFAAGDDFGDVSGAPDITTAHGNQPPIGSYPFIASLGTLVAQDYLFHLGHVGTLQVVGSSSSPAETVDRQPEPYVQEPPRQDDAGSASVAAIGSGDAKPLAGDTIGYLNAAAAREAERSVLYGDAIARLERDPSEPDLPDCRPSDDLKTQCIPPRPLRPLAEGETGDVRRKVAYLFANSDYGNGINDLITPEHDAEHIGQVLRDDFGYEVRLMKNADRRQMVSALKEAAELHQADESVLVYYAGHGVLVKGNGYWLPVDANPRNPKSWLSNNDINKFLALIPAKQVMMVSDSCFSGTLAKEQQLKKGAGHDKRQLLARRAVTVMSSGDVEPVSDEGKDGHSIFAYSFVQQLKAAKAAGYVEGVDFFDAIRHLVTAEYPQLPQYSASLNAGHMSGADYFLEPK
ncbi:two-partner secretion domain-containing protein [Chitinimonas koreensis]|nr:YDG domain-containing protein [Chitinimonas koreensis]QNM98590.1 filamentous hemagglutinin N-terminal domain-containing protein [Chitinimonas koreensis]